MGAIGNAVTGMLRRAKQDATFRQELQDNPKQVLERELGRKLSKEELEAALAELKKRGIDTKPARS
ncbi:MAG TPA: hypothetical protein VF634_11460 [Pyrinomonadaceae bacterium]